MEKSKRLIGVNGLKVSLKADFLRMFSTPLLYIMSGICFAVPIAMLIMTSMMGSTEGEASGTFTNVWQAISSVSGSSGGMSMDLTSMCNINLVYFAAAIFVCLFVAAEFKSGYVKNLFTCRAQKGGYVVSKTITGIIAGMIMILCFFVGAMIGGAIAGLPFATEGFNAANLVACIFTKLFLMGVFAPIAMVMAVLAKQKTWLSICLCLAAGALLFMMIPMMTPLNAGILQVILCLAGGILFAVGLSFVANLILKKTNIL